jgi:hypothetical protein
MEYAALLPESRSHATSNTGVENMGIVIPFPTKQVMDDELATQLWELVMAGEIGSAEYRRLDAEINRRRAMSAPRREPVRAGGPWR